MLSYVSPLYPNKEQKEKLEFALDACRFTYNALLHELRKHEKISRGKIQHKIVELEEEYPRLREIYSKTLQHECYRLFSNLSTLKELKKKGRKVGMLRFKGKDWFKTITYNQSGFSLEKKTEKRAIIHLSKIGGIKMKTHRIVTGNIKQLILKKSAGRWYIIIQTDAKRRDMQHGVGVIGIDLGVESYLTKSDGSKIENPKTLQTYIEKLKEMQKSLSRKSDRGANRRKARVALTKLYIKISNIRKDFLHKTSTKLVKENCFIAFERLKIREMTQGNYHALNRNIADASWNTFLQMLCYKAESAGCEVAEVDPTGTSKRCSNCGELQEMQLFQRIYNCAACGMIMDRDRNAAINILKKASGGLGWTSEEMAKVPLMSQEATAVKRW